MIIHLGQGKSQAPELGQTVAWTKNNLSISDPFSSISPAASFFTTWDLCVEKQLINYSMSGSVRYCCIVKHT